MNSALRGLLAAVAPVLILGPPLAWWGRPEAPSAGSDLARRFDKAVAGGPEVVLLGASKVTTDLDHAQLAAAFGVPKAKLVPLNVYGSNAGVWYAVLEERVYGNGHEPSVILVYSTMDWTLASRPSSDQERSVILGQLSPEETVVREKFLGSGLGGPVADRIRRRRTEDHSQAMAWVRNVAVGLTLAREGEGDPATRGAALAGPALTTLFEGVEAASKGAVPIVEEKLAQAAVPTDLDQTLLPDFLTLAAAHGARIVFVNAPVRQSVAARRDVPPELLAAAVGAINTAGAGYVDLRDLNLSDSVFGDGVHMNRAGRAATTRALVERLRANGAIGDGPIAPAAVPVPAHRPTLRRVGTPPALKVSAPRRGEGACDWIVDFIAPAGMDDFSLGRAGVGASSPLVLFEDGVPLKPHAGRAGFADSCAGAFVHQVKGLRFSPTGDVDAGGARTYTLGLSEALPLPTATGRDAWWVYPGTTLEVGVQDAHPGGPGYSLELEALAFGAGQGRVEVGGQAAALEGEGLHRTVTLPLPAPTEPWTVRLSSPADGPYLLVSRLAYGTDTDRRYLYGRGDGMVNVIASRVVFAAPPPDAHVSITPGADGTFTLDGAPDSKVQYAVASVAGCSPVRVYEDGVPFPAPLTRRSDAEAAAGSVAVVSQTLYVHPADGSDPTRNGRAYTVGLDASHKCQSLRWIYPGDHATFSVDAAQLATLPGSATRVELGGAAIEDPPTTAATAHLRVLGGEVVYLDVEVPLATLVSSPPAWDLAEPIPRDAPLTVELSTPPDAPYLLLTSIGVGVPR